MITFVFLGVRLQQLAVEWNGCVGTWGLCS